MALADAISGAASQAEDTSVDELHDYYNVLDGFAVKAPAKTLEEIKNLDGVKNAFVEHMYSVSADQQDSGLELKNQTSLDITQADDVEQKGDGQVIAIIDTGIDTDHEAFSGDLDDSKVALTQGGAAQARSTMKAVARTAPTSARRSRSPMTMPTATPRSTLASAGLSTARTSPASRRPTEATRSAAPRLTPSWPS